MNLPDRRSVLAAAAAFGATAAASAQSSEPIIGNKGATIMVDLARSSADRRGATEIWYWPKRATRRNKAAH
ncbi:hypothetical protein ACVIHD_006810 [Bradyrhizobium embrapense]